MTKRICTNFFSRFKKRHLFIRNRACSEFLCSLLRSFSSRWVQVITFLRITPKRLEVKCWNFHTM